MGKIKEFYKNGELVGKLYLGDCLEILPTIDKNSCMIAITSPPYNLLNQVGYCEDKEYIKEILEVSGFQEIVITDNQEDIVMFSGKSIREASEDYLTINPVVTEMLKNSGDELKEEILEALITKFSDFHKNEGLLFPSATWIVTAKK